MTLRQFADLLQLISICANLQVHPILPETTDIKC